VSEDEFMFKNVNKDKMTMTKFYARVCSKFFKDGCTASDDDKHGVAT